MAALSMMPSSSCRQCVVTGKLPSYTAVGLDRGPLLRAFQMQRHTGFNTNPAGRIAYCCKASVANTGSTGCSGRESQEANPLLPQINGQKLLTLFGKFAQGAAVAALAFVLVSSSSSNTCACDCFDACTA